MCELQEFTDYDIPVSDSVILVTDWTHALRRMQISGMSSIL
jgi:hypothetical protein